MTDKTTVSLGSALNIMNVSGLKTRLAAALSKNLQIVLISDKIEKADTAGLQLIYSFIVKAKEQGNSVSWQKPSDALFQACETLGMSEALCLKPD